MCFAHQFTVFHAHDGIAADHADSVDDDISVGHPIETRADGAIVFFHALGEIWLLFYPSVGDAITEGQAVENHPGLFGRVRLVVARSWVFAHVIFATGVGTDIAVSRAVDKNVGFDQNSLAGKPRLHGLNRVVLHVRAAERRSEKRLAAAGGVQQAANDIVHRARFERHMGASYGVLPTD